MPNAQKRKEFQEKIEKLEEGKAVVLGELDQKSAEQERLEKEAIEEKKKAGLIPKTAEEIEAERLRVEEEERIDKEENEINELRFKKVEIIQKDIADKMARVTINARKAQLEKEQNEIALQREAILRKLKIIDDKKKGIVTPPVVVEPVIITEPEIPPEIIEPVVPTVPEIIPEPEEIVAIETEGEWDAVIAEAAKLVVNAQHGSTNMIQRRLNLGYNRAGKVMEQLEKLGIVGKGDGNKPREVLVFDEVSLEEKLKTIKTKDNTAFKDVMSTANELEEPKLEEDKIVDDMVEDFENFKKKASEKAQDNSFVKFANEKLPTIDKLGFLAEMREISQWINKEKRGLLPVEVLKYFDMFKSIESDTSKADFGRATKKEMETAIVKYKSDIKNLDSITYKNGLSAMLMKLSVLEKSVKAMESEEKSEPEEPEIKTKPNIKEAKSVEDALLSIDRWYDSEMKTLKITPYVPKNNIGFLPAPNPDGSFAVGMLSKESSGIESVFNVEDLGNDRFALTVMEDSSAVIKARQEDGRLLKLLGDIKDESTLGKKKVRKITTTNPAIYRKEGDKFIREDGATFYYSTPEINPATLQTFQNLKNEYIKQAEEKFKKPSKESDKE